MGARVPGILILPRIPPPVPGCSPAEVDRILSMLGSAGSTTDDMIYVRSASVRLAIAYRKLSLRLETWRFFGSFLILLTLFFISIPVYVAVEGWSSGESAWFLYITFSTIGLGDFTPKSYGGEIYLYFYVLCSFGLLAIFVTAAILLADNLKLELQSKHKRRRSRPARP